MELMGRKMCELLQQLRESVSSVNVCPLILFGGFLGFI